MQYHGLPGTSLKVSALSLGAMMFGGQTNEADSLAIMDYAYGSGINFLGAAGAYNQGESECIVGKTLKGHGSGGRAARHEAEGGSKET